MPRATTGAVARGRQPEAEGAEERFLRRTWARRILERDSIAIIR